MSWSNLGALTHFNRGQLDQHEQESPAGGKYSPIFEGVRRNPWYTWRNGSRQAPSGRAIRIVLAFLLGAVSAYTFLMCNPAGLSTKSTWSLRYRMPLQACNPIPLSKLGLSPMARHVKQANVRDLTRLIVAARHHEIDEPDKTIGAQHATIANKGNEAMAYLQFIIDYYDQLPDSIVFLHGHRSSWHLLDIVPILQRLRWGSHGFAPLRYRNAPGDRLDWECGSRTENPIWRQFDCDWEGAHLRPGNMSLRAAVDVNEVSKDLWVDSLEMSQVWPQVFQKELGPVPAEMKSPCCSTFMVSRERIHVHDVKFYIHLRDWIIRTEMNSYRTGRMLEYTWHIIFGEAAVIEALPECELIHCHQTVGSTWPWSKAGSDSSLNV